MPRSQQQLDSLACESDQDTSPGSAHMTAILRGTFCRNFLIWTHDTVDTYTINSESNVYML
jgi:hypothetical protein